PVDESRTECGASFRLVFGGSWERAPVHRGDRGRRHRSLCTCTQRRRERFVRSEQCRCPSPPRQGASSGVRYGRLVGIDCHETARTPRLCDSALICAEAFIALLLVEVVAQRQRVAMRERLGRNDILYMKHDGSIARVFEQISVHLPKGLDQRRLAVIIDRVSILRSFHPVDANRTSTLRLRREVAWFAPSKGLLDFPNSFRGRSRIENQLSERKELLSQVRRVRLEYGCHVIRNSFFPAGDA